MRLCFLFLILLGATGAWSQPGATDSSRRIEILSADRYNFEKKDSANTFLSLAGQVKLRQAGTLFYADSAVLNQNTNIIEAFGNIHINDGDSIHTYSRYLRYRGNDKQAFLKNNVKLADNKGSVLTTSELYYDMNLGIADYRTGGKVINKKTILTSRNARYYDGVKDVIFSNEVVLVDAENRVTTDSLQYNVTTEVATFIAPTTIVSGKRKVRTSKGFYDLKTRKAELHDRSTIVDSTFSIVANNMAFDDQQGLGDFRGNVVYIDTANGVSILSDQLFANKAAGSFLATKQPLMILEQEEDSVFITADTLFSGKITALSSRTIPLIADTSNGKNHIPDLQGADSSRNRFFEAWHHVRIFSDSVQAAADSLFYAGTDSAFRLFQKPIVWANDSQITGDTIYLFTANKKPSKMEAFFNGFIVSRTPEMAFNQVKGNTINAWFKEGNIDYVRAKGRAESIYYIQDDQAKYIGLNRSSADAIDMFFEERNPKKVKYINDLKGITYPIGKIPGGQDRLNGFKWMDELRPKTKEELFGR